MFAKKISMKALVLSILMGMGSSPVQAEPLSDCPAIQLSIASKIPVRFQTYLANEPDTMSQGLMGVEYLPPDRAMLFDFGHERNVGFWMKNTLIPLDMIFISEAGVVVSIHENAIPHDVTTIASPVPVRYVLEINGGLSRGLGLKAGQHVSARHSAKQCSNRPD